MLSSKKLALANSQIALLTAQLTAAGINAEDLLAEDASPEFLKDAIQSKIDAASGPSAESVIKDVFGESIQTHDVATAKSHLETLASDAAESEALDSKVTAFETGLKDAGVKLAIEEGATLDAKAVSSAITARASTVARERLASHGITTEDAPETTVSPDATAPEKKPENRRNSHAMNSLKKLGLEES